jgi:hypothetical protein
MIFLLLSVLSFNINAIEDTCDFQGGELNCIGEKVTNDELKKIGAKLTHLSESSPLRTINTINIINTSITEIEANTFVNTTLTQLHIINNSKLTSIDPKAFIQNENFDHFHVLKIVNNSQLTGPNLFELSNNLDTQTELVLTGNAIKEVPENALNNTNKGGSLKHINLNHNHIEKIGKKAFSAMNQIAVIEISHNRINTIGDEAFYMMQATQSVVLDLSYNKITSESISVYSITTIYGFKPLNLSNNNITTLPKNVWGGLTNVNAINNQIILSGNDIICDCKTKWFLSTPFFASPYRVPDGTFCANTKKKFTDMTEKDFGCY